jgi:hypothetical protein
VVKEQQNQAASDSAEKVGRPKSAKRTLIGVVVGDKMDKTRVVVVERRLAHDPACEIQGARREERVPRGRSRGDYRVSTAVA